MAGFFPDTETDCFAQEHGVVGRIDRNVPCISGNTLNTVTAGHADNTVRLCGNYGLHLALNAQVHAAIIRNSSGNHFLTCLLQNSGQLFNLLFAAGLTCGCTASTANDRNGFCIRDHGHNFFKRFLLRNDHVEFLLLAPK